MSGAGTDTAGALERHDTIGVTVATTLNDILQVAAVRAVVYMGEQNCPYHEEFDGNDFAGATHLIARVGDEPAGVMRLRWFADFAKVERAAVRLDYRGGAVASALIKAALGLMSRKGYRRALGHIQARLAPFWVRSAGATIRKDRERFVFSDHVYVEVEVPVPSCAKALTMDSPPLELLRQEGSWDHPGILDFSAARQATAPGAPSSNRTPGRP